jgi:hypothetical protein
MEHSYSWEANSHSDGQKIHWFLWNTRLHFHIHNSPQSLGPCAAFHNIQHAVSCRRSGVLATTAPLQLNTTPKLQPTCKGNFFHLQPVDMLCSGNRQPTSHAYCIISITYCSHSSEHLLCKEQFCRLSVSPKAKNLLWWSQLMMAVCNSVCMYE